MLQGLRILNPRGRRGTSKWPSYATRNPRKRGRNPKKVKVVHTPSGKRYLIGGKFVSAATAKRVRAARRNPKGKVIATATSSRIKWASGHGPKRKRSTKATRVKKTKKTTRRSPVAKAKKRKGRRLRGKALAKFRRAHPKTKSGKFKKRAGGGKKRRAAPKRRRIRKVTITVKANRRRRRRTRRVSSNPRLRRRAYSASATRRRASWYRGGVGPRRRRRNPRTASASSAKRKVGSWKGRKVYSRGYKSTRGKKFNRYYVSANPGMKDVSKLLVKGATFWAALTGVKVAGNWLGQKLATTDFVKNATGTTAKLYGLLPSAGLFAAALFLPKVLKGKTELVGTIQLGATVALCEAVFSKFIKPMITDANTLALFSGDQDQFSFQPTFAPSMPLAEYTNQDNRFGLGEYVEFDNRYSGGTGEMDGEDVAFMQTGGAGGSLAHTVFSQ